MANNCLYQRLRKEVSYDGGYTYEPTGEYVVGDLLEEDSFECSYMTNYVFTIPNVGRETSSSITSGATNLQYQVTSTKNGQGATYSIVSPAWMSVEKTWSGVSIDVQANGTGTDRNATVRFIQDDSGLEIHIFIAQVSDQSGYVFCFNGGASSESLSASTIGGSFSYNVVSTYLGEAQPFSVTSSPAWLTTSLSGNVLSITMGENTGATKTGNVVLTQSGSSKTITVAAKQEKYDTSGIYFAFEVVDDNFSFQCTSAVSYSTDMENWTTSTSSPNFNSGTIVYIKSTTPDRTKAGVFTTSGRFNVIGNAMSLLYADNFSGQTYLNAYALRGLLIGCTGLINAESLSLPATTIGDYCYTRMFSGCTSLITAPEIAATTVGEHCCEEMFCDCTSLVTAPSILPAPTLAYNCYESMFYCCGRLTTAPELPATTLAGWCYAHMFEGCVSMEIAPSILPAERAAGYCCKNMFQGCTSLTTAPELPATTASTCCYENMFLNCKSLTAAPSLPATTLGQNCYKSMFVDCISITTAPTLSALTLVNGCYCTMFNGCTSLNSITCLATDISAPSCTDQWVLGVASSGTFTKDPSMTDWTTGDDGIPTNWTVQDYNP